MANPEQLEILKQGHSAWNKWRTENPAAEIDLTRASLRGVHLSRADLKGADLSNASFVETNFSQADLREANLQQTDLRGADLFEARLNGANLEGADLKRANLNGANLTAANLNEARLNLADLSRAKLHKASLSNAQLAFTIFAFMDLGVVTGFDSVIHRAPSCIGIETIFNSKGKIPEIFLRGCGLSDMEIETAKLAVPGLDPEQVTEITNKIHQLYLGGGIQYYSCFISYSNKDHEIAQQIHDDLQNNGVRCWFAPEDMKIGDPIRPTIDRQIRLRDKLLVILSENSVKSEWVGDEVEAGLEEEQKNSRLVLFPIRLDDSVMNAPEDWAAKIRRRRHIGDFSNWQDKASYKKAFERLLRDLKAPRNGVEPIKDE